MPSGAITSGTVPQKQWIKGYIYVFYKKTTFCLSLNFLVSKSFSYKKHGCFNNTRLALTYSGNSAALPPNVS